MTQNLCCPRCGETMLWNGHGMACIACSYVTAKQKPPSEKKIPVPKRKKSGERK